MILDTNALSAWADGNKSVMQILVQQESLALPVVVIGEYRFGLIGSKLNSILEPKIAYLERAARVLNISLTTAQAYANIRAELKKTGKPIPSNDAWIAALAREHDLPILSQDAHFDFVIGITRFTW